MFKKIVLLTASALLVACSGAETSTQSVSADKMKDMATKAVAMNTKTKAVLVYADWCGSCKVLDPKIEKVKSMGSVPGIDFVVLDYTDKNADNFYAQAEAAGVEEAVRTFLDGTIKTGQLLLVDMDDQTVRGKVTKDFDVAAIIDSMKSAVAAS